MCLALVEMMRHAVIAEVADMQRMRVLRVHVWHHRMLRSVDPVKDVCGALVPLAAANQPHHIPALAGREARDVSEEFVGEGVGGQS
jgi:hypothetical protein